MHTFVHLFSRGSRPLTALLALPCLLATGTSALAASGQAQPAPAPAQSSGSVIPDLNFSWSGYFEALAILCFVLAVLWAVLWFVRRKSGGTLFRGSNIPGMRIESRLALGPKKWLMVVRYLDKRLVIGITDRNISLITELPVDDVPPPPPGPPLRQTPPVHANVPPAAPQPLQKAAENSSFDAFLQQNKGGGA